MNKWKLKTEVFLVSQKTNQGIRGTLLLKTQLCSLGVHLDKSLNLDAQILVMARSALYN